MIGEWIRIACLKVIWGVVIEGPLCLINAFEPVLNYLSGGIVWKMLFNNEKEFSWKSLPNAFWGFSILAASIICILFLIQFITILFSDTKEMRNKLMLSIKMTLYAFCFIFFIPIGFFLLNSAITFFAQNINWIFGKKLNIASMIYQVGNPNWNGESLSRTDFGPPTNIGDYNMITEIICTFFVGYSVVMIGFAVIQKVFELFFLFIISPVVSATMATDNGKRMRTWKDLVIGKSLASVGAMVSYNTFIIGVSKLVSGSEGEKEKLGSFGWQLLTIFIVSGGAIATIGFSRIIASLVGESVSVSEGSSSLRSTFAAGRYTLGLFGKGIKGANWMLGGKKRKVGTKTNNEASNDNERSNQNSDNNSVSEHNNQNEGFTLPSNSMRERSGLVGFVGSALSQGTSAVYAITHPMQEARIIKEKLHKRASKLSEGFKNSTSDVWKAKREYNKKTK